MDQATVDDAHTLERRKRQAEIKERLADIIARDPDKAAIDLLNLALALWAERYPAQLSALELEKVGQNFQGATPSLIAERAMSEEGLLMAMVSLAHTATIAIDYSPDSFCKNLVDADMAHERAGKSFAGALQGAFKQATADGLSAYGAMSMMILFGAVFGTKAGLKWPLVSRPLIETLGKAMELGAPPQISEGEAEEQAIRILMQQMGISRQVALRYVAHHRAQRAADEQAGKAPN